MAITYKSSGAGVSTESSGAALSPACPATVDAGDILILQTAWEGTTSAPSDPAGWTLLSGPQDVGSAAVVARHWVYGKIADGSEDGATVDLGSPAVTTMRAARIHSFAGRVSGTITDLVPAASFTNTVGDSDPTGPTVTTTIAGSLACALVYQNDNNTLETFAGSSDTWTERGTVGGYIFALAPGGVLDLLTATPAADPGTVSGGAMTVLNDPWGVIGFEIRPSVPTTTVTKTVSLGALLQKQAILRTSALDALLRLAGLTRTAALDALLRKNFSASTALSAALLKQGVLQATSADAFLRRTGLTRATNLDALLVLRATTAALLDALLKAEGVARTAAVDALLKKEGVTRSAALDSFLRRTGLTRTASLDAMLAKQQAIATGLDALLSAGSPTRTAAMDALLLKQAVLHTAALDAYLRRQGMTSAASLDAQLRRLSIGASAGLDAQLRKTGIPRTAALDALLRKEVSRVAALGALIRRTGLTRAALFDAVLSVGLSGSLAGARNVLWGEAKVREIEDYKTRTLYGTKRTRELH